MQQRKELNNVLNTDKIGRLMLKLSLPVFLGIFVQTLYNVINTIFVGQYTGSLGIAGLSIVFPIQMFGVGLGTLAGIGGMSLISRLLGSQERDRAEKALGNGIFLSVILGAVVVIETGASRDDRGPRGNSTGAAATRRVERSLDVDVGANPVVAAGRLDRQADETDVHRDTEWVGGEFEHHRSGEAEGGGAVAHDRDAAGRLEIEEHLVAVGIRSGPDGHEGRRNELAVRVHSQSS